MFAVTCCRWLSEAEEKANAERGRLQNNLVLGGFCVWCRFPFDFVVELRIWWWGCRRTIVSPGSVTGVVFLDITDLSLIIIIFRRLNA